MKSADLTFTLKFLSEFKHGHRTDLAKRTMNNRDAIAVLLFRCGPMSVRMIRDAMMTWRFGRPVYYEKKCLAYTRPTRYPPNRDYSMRTVYRNRPKMGFTYAFNTSTSGGYGCVGKNVYSRGTWMSTSWQGTMDRPPKDADERRSAFFRRQYWWRMGRGVYAPTMECIKRMAELGVK